MSLSINQPTALRATEGTTSRSGFILPGSAIVCYGDFMDYLVVLWSVLYTLLHLTYSESLVSFSRSSETGLGDISNPANSTKSAPVKSTPATFPSSPK